MNRTPENLLDRPGGRVDPLSEVLAMLDVRTTQPYRLEAGGHCASTEPADARTTMN
jgi:hypothetical protein